MESLSHVLQKCPVTHFERIEARRPKGGVTIEEEEMEPRVYHPDRHLFKSDLANHLSSNDLVYTDAQVSDCSLGRQKNGLRQSEVQRSCGTTLAR